MKIPDKYDEQIKASVEKYWPEDIDWRWWKAQLYQESLLNPDAVSPVGAMGLAQFMPKTWKGTCKKLHWKDVSPFSPDHSILAGAFYMARMANGWSSKRPTMDRWDLARASYNAGFGNLLKAQKKADNAVLYADIIKALPAITGRHSKETITYVEKIHYWFGVMTEQPSTP